MRMITLALVFVGLTSDRVFAAECAKTSPPCDTGTGCTDGKTCTKVFNSGYETCLCAKKAKKAAYKPKAVSPKKQPIASASLQ